MLDNAGIPCFVKNEFAIGGIGDLAPFDCLPEVWLADEEWEPKAKRLLKELLEQNHGEEDWFCPFCKEKNAANFEICWNCGKEST